MERRSSMPILPKYTAMYKVVIVFALIALVSISGIILALMHNRRVDPEWKMMHIDIDECDFRDTSMQEIFSYLQARSIHCDATTKDVGKKGVNIVLNLQSEPSPCLTFSAHDISLYDVISKIVKSMGLKWRIQGSCVVIEYVEPGASRNGIFAYLDGGRYRGNLVKGRRNGFGSLVSADGLTYTGTWDDDKLLRGTLTYPDSRRFEGVFSNEVWRGRSILKNGAIYTGTWINGAFVNGTYTVPGLGKYDGDFSNDLLSGKGSFTRIDGATYNGLWLNGVLHEGTYCAANGVRYEGAFSNMLFNGQGKLVSNRVTYSGTWEQSRHLSGSIIYPDGVRYDGNFSNGLFTGYGVLSSNGETYAGIWVASVLQITKSAHSNDVHSETSRNAISNSLLIALQKARDIKPTVDLIGAIFTARTNAPNAEIRVAVLKVCGSGLLFLGKKETYVSKLKEQIPDSESFEESMTAPCALCKGAKSVTIDCHFCSGTGECPGCRGHPGFVVVPRFGGGNSAHKCHTCQGTGVCQKCGGKKAIVLTCSKCFGNGLFFDPMKAKAAFYREIAGSLEMFRNLSM